MPEARFPDIDPNADIAEMGEWVMRGKDFWHARLQRHPDWSKLQSDAQSAAIVLTKTHAFLIGAILGVREVGGNQNELINNKLSEWENDYRERRLSAIRCICLIYIRGVAIERKLSGEAGGKPLKLMPDYNEPPPPATNPRAQRKWKNERFEFDIAVKLLNKKIETGKFTGLDEMLNEAVNAGLISLEGDPRQRILRLARRLFNHKDLHVTPGLNAALQGADRWSLTDRGY